MEATRNVKFFLLFWVQFYAVLPGKSYTCFKSIDSLFISMQGLCDSCSETLTSELT